MKRTRESGIALVSALLIMVLVSALVVGFFALVSADQRNSGINRDQTQAYAAAHAGLEKLTADLGALFTGGNFSPTVAQLNGLEGGAPTIPGFQYLAPDGSNGFTITWNGEAGGNPPGPIDPNGTVIQNGPFQGLRGLITPYEITVTARASDAANGAAEVRMRREMQTIAVPVFQFGIYSENDLSFFAGSDFNFGGFVHTNQNLYLAQDGGTLTLNSRVTAVGEVVRTHLANGHATGNGGGTAYTATVRVTTGAGFRNLAGGEGSVNVASVPPSTLQVVDGRPTMVLTPGNTPNDPTFTGLSLGDYNQMLRNGRTGARRLDLPLVSDGAQPVDIIRRPPVNTADIPNIQRQRFYHLASLRILLSDREADLTGLQNATAAAPVNLRRLATDAAYRAGLGVNWVNNIPLALSGVGGGYRLPAGEPMIDGFLKIERQDVNGNWFDVTVELLNLGFTGRALSNGTWLPDMDSAAERDAVNAVCAAAADNPAPNAVIRLQRVRDDPSNQSVGWRCGRSSAAGNPWSATATDYIPLVVYDPREGARRDILRVEETANCSLGAAATCPMYMGGVMHYIELDVNNLRRWIEGTIGATGANNTMNVTGYVVYFSDRRGNKDLGPDSLPATRAGADGLLGTADDFGDDRETGEFGFEDFINPASATSVSNNVLDNGEDVNGNGVLDTYGAVARGYPGATAPIEGTALLTSTVDATVARLNPPVFFRRSLKLVNGGYDGTLRLPRNGSQGLTVAAENPVYVLGNYNAPNAAGNGWGATPGTDHVSAAVVADAVSLLSRAHNDMISFKYPHDSSDRNGLTSWFRLAIISGKGLNFTRPTSNDANDHRDFGTDGGAHNFLRYIEDMGGQTLNYRGSIVSFFINRQAVGTYKCCDVVYGVPTRGYNFDEEFLNPNLLPPRTPMFRDVNTLTFRQLLRPTQ